MTETFVVKLSLSSTGNGDTLPVGQSASINIDEKQITPLSVSNWIPDNGTTAVGIPLSQISIVFDRNIKAGTGNITIRKLSSTGDIVETIDITSSTAKIIIINKTLNIVPDKLLNATNYYIVIPSGAITDMTGTVWSGTSTYNFTTAAATIVTPPVKVVPNPTSFDTEYTMNTIGDYSVNFTSLPTSPFAIQIIVDGTVINGTNGTNKPLLYWEDPTNNVTKDWAAGDYPFGTVRSQTSIGNTSENHPLKFIYSKSSTIVQTLIVRVSWFPNDNKQLTHNFVVPVAIQNTVVAGIPHFALYQGSSGSDPFYKFMPDKINGCTGWEHGFKTDDTRVLGTVDKKYGNWAYIDSSGKTVQANTGAGFITFPSGQKSFEFEIHNIGTAADTLTGITIAPNTTTAGYGQSWLSSVTTTFSNLFVKDSTKFSGYREVSFPVTLDPGYKLRFTVNVTWPHVLNMIDYDWSQWNITAPYTPAKVGKLATAKAIAADYKASVVDQIATLKTDNLLTWNITPQASGLGPTYTGTVTMSILNKAIVAGDPLAQTFYVNESEHPDGYFVSSVDLFFKTKSAVDDITVQIRPVVNGYPSSKDIVPFAIATLSPDLVNVSTYPDPTSVTSYTKFKFDSPIYLSGGQYAIVIISSSKDYEVFTSTLGGFRLNDLDSRISEVSYVGDIFKSSNSETWIASGNQDLCFVVNRADFKPTGTALFTSNKPSDSYSSYFNVFTASTHYNKGEYVRVQQSTNLDRIYEVLTSGTSGTTTPTHTSGDVASGGCTLRYISTGTRVDPTKILYDVYFMQGENVNFRNSEARYFYKGTSESGILDIDYQNIMLGSNYELNTRKLLDSDNSDLYSKIELSTNDSKLSPVVDIARLSNVLVKNIINDSTIAPDFVANTAVTNGDYIKVYTDATKTYNMYSVIRAGTTSNAAPMFNNDDTLNGSALLRFEGTTNNGDTELLSSGGLAKARYMTRKVVLAPGFESTDIVVRFNAYAPAGTTVKVYYKADFINGATTLEQTPYREMILSERAAEYTSSFVEHKFICDYSDNINPLVRYALPNKQTFNQFSIKIVMLSANPVVVPKIRDLRAIALND